MVCLYIFTYRGGYMRNKKMLVLTVLFFLFTGIMGLLAQDAGYQLDRAKASMDRGEYRYALDQFNSIAQNSYFPREIVKEAAYYIGFCYVKLSDPWSAIRAYESFLDRFDRGSGYDSRFVPDALYVLGRTYEEVRDTARAANCYRRCSDRFPSSEFAMKSRDRLRVLGGGGYDPGHGGDGYVSPDIRDLVDLAKSSPNSYTRDEMLLKAAKKARNGADYKYIIDATNNDYTKGSILDIAAKSSNFSFMSIYDVVRLARSTNNSYNRDEFLLAAARKCARTGSDFKALVDATNNSYTKQQILEIAQDVLGRNGPVFSMMEAEPVAKSAKPAKKTAAKAGSKLDPFENFTMDKAKVERISAFVDAVKNRKNVDESMKKLSKDDSSSEIVKETMKEYSKMKKFDNLHNAEK